MGFIALEVIKQKSMCPRNVLHIFPNLKVSRMLICLEVISALLSCLFYCTLLLCLCRFHFSLNHPQYVACDYLQFIFYLYLTVVGVM